MLSDYTNQRRAAGETLILARSFASILMTTIAMVFGMLIASELEQVGKNGLAWNWGLVVHSCNHHFKAPHLVKTLASLKEKKRNEYSTFARQQQRRCLAAKQNLRWHFSFKQLFYFSPTLLKCFGLIAYAF
jgi:hypothetical protein